MPAEITSRVFITTHVPGGEPVRFELGTITVPMTGHAVAEEDVRRALGELLQAAGAYIAEGSALAAPGEGESGFPA
ncbi:hypothetical protein ACFRNT_14255 [Streptomyces sp. NPDC056697]|uniref:hypothetical protein n=1 Tax=Streptomyces sp. NPDC056697 TaxID=3345915 RepID=UPI0036AC9ECE